MWTQVQGCDALGGLHPDVEIGCLGVSDTFPRIQPRDPLCFCIYRPLPDVPPPSLVPVPVSKLVRTFRPYIVTTTVSLPPLM